jgi:ribosome biogenesis GTPase
MELALGTVLRSHAGGYVVYQGEAAREFQCTARGRLKKENVSILTGDKVELDELSLEQATAVIVTRLPRTNVLTRPPLANVDQIVIVQAIHQPDWNPLWCDRHLVHFQLEIPSATFVLCFNKCDLASPEEIEALRSIYEPLGYVVMIVSAKIGDGVNQLNELLRDKVSVFSGPSGVGKSSLLNRLDPQLQLRVGVMENDFGVGRHTTTASELYRLKTVDGVDCAWVADTPGFGVAELRHPAPGDVAMLFPEFTQLADQCRYANCLHILEDDCNVKANLHALREERFKSYCTLVAEAQSEQKMQQDSSNKVEANVKLVGGKEGRAKVIPRLNGRYRAPSRRSEKQKLIVTEIDDQDHGGLDEEDKS